MMQERFGSAAARPAHVSKIRMVFLGESESFKYPKTKGVVH